MQKINSIPNFFQILQRFAKLLLWVIWERFIMSINNHSITFYPTLVPKVLKSTCRSLWYLSACKKSTSSLSTFLRYCTDIVNLLFWEIWKWLTIFIKIIVSICSNFSCLPGCKKSTSPFTSLLRYWREIANFLFRVIRATHVKNDSITLKKRLTIISREKNHSNLHPLHFPWDIARIL